MSDLTELSAADLGRGIGSGEIDPVALTQAFLDKIEAHPLADRIYARLTPDRALAEAEAARKRAAAGQRRSPLDGVPVSWKDLFDTAGVATEAGSKLLENRIPEDDAEVLKVATAMGLVCLGKTHMSELAFSGLGLNPVTGTPPSVNDPDAVPGGSSSGAAASVAFGLAPAAIGSDTGGSVRIPSAWNDLVGLKTTAGRMSLDGVVPLAKTFDTVGPLCRTVEDAALVFAALEGRAAPDLRGASLKGRRFARLTTIVLDDLRPEPAKAYATALDRLADAGAEIVDLDVPELAVPMGDAGLLFTTEAWANWGEAIDANPDVMFPPIRERFAAGRNANGAEHWRALERMAAARAAWAAATAEFDAVLCPTAPNLPPNLAKLMEQGEYYVTENLLTLRNTRVGNVMGLCALSLPTGLPSCGISLMCPPNAEDRLLRLGAAAEAALA
ncbi:MAG: amidase [Rhodobacteraceae bacterium]|uniref:Aspartyl-tRNA(Asn)/glutamyl-tRNA(Gln) amidotransferase subunit A n=1 Tax=Salipiger profundus TaxID=1229727 RepID=A0A1U7D5C7_9RHOB|nr:MULTISPECIES: amidase family protein [Salipiger]APX23374.1 aspartyl-tRNA(Asn)/glutamyl-tRNA(Gln) amidotransferase subunit A [Salipiger profundus]MAB09133.1 amidase [Paracoccaceae bacterium]GGA24248.1 amidase [Salipiger profundus]SFD45213.1 aspartyl-tRNA(Asn)/glutamyl-tRNA(Gln) amidotransferase subunit A [Salipiger profundus]